MQVPAPAPSLLGGYDLNYVLFNLMGPEAAQETIMRSARSVRVTA